ncbi:hypothetical protein, partial [Xanthomonas hortorum]|uniref:hypothetical protein n=1 Tax=Xanthomonas hortorum TaxID=56454 RepID=UPI00204325EB
EENPPVPALAIPTCAIKKARNSEIIEKCKYGPLLESEALMCVAIPHDYIAKFGYRLHAVRLTRTACRYSRNNERLSIK